MKQLSAQVVKANKYLLVLTTKFMKTLTVVIPVYNESKRLDKAFRALTSFKPRGVILEKITFVNDGSKDNTLEIINEFSKKYSTKLMSEAVIEIITYKRNRGRGYAVKRGLLNVSSDYGLYMDADMSIPFENLSKYISYMEQDYDVLIGSKKKPGAKAIPERSLVRKIVGYGHTLCATTILGVFTWDFQGGFKMFSKQFIEEVITHTKQERWGFDMEVIFWAKKLAYKFVELPAVWGVTSEGTTVRLGRDICRALADMFSIQRSYIRGSLLTWIPRASVK